MDGEKQKCRLLVIDDEEETLASCQELLAQRGFMATTCSESVQAIPLLKAGSYDAVLLDIRMPGIEGADLLPLIKKIRPEIPVIIVSAYANEASVSYYHSLGAFAVLAKPFSQEVLMETIARALDHQESIPLVLTNLSLREARDQVYRKLILSALLKTNWNQVKASELLGVSRYCLMRWIRKLGISY